ncbi:MAG: Holliday junction resolvase RuvX [Chloroflexota bacterium]
MTKGWGRILAIDPGDRRIGIALSDPTGTIANPLTVIRHVSRQVDAALIAQIANEHDAVMIIIGQALDSFGLPGASGRKAARLAEIVRTQTSIPVVLWDESGSTQTARAAAAALGSKRKRARSHLDELAATVILQSYLDQRSYSSLNEE